MYEICRIMTEDGRSTVELLDRWLWASRRRALRMAHACAAEHCGQRVKIFSTKPSGRITSVFSYASPKPERIGYRFEIRENVTISYQVREHSPEPAPEAPAAAATFDDLWWLDAYTMSPGEKRRRSRRMPVRNQHARAGSAVPRARRA